MSRILNSCRLFPGRKYKRSFATHIRRCVFIICKIPLFVLGINIGILVSFVKLPDEVCASHTKRVGENKKGFTTQVVRRSAAHWITLLKILEPFPKLLYLVINLYISGLPNTRQLSIIGIIMHLKFVESLSLTRCL